MNNNLVRLKFTKDYEANIITIRLENKTDVKIPFDDLDF